MAAVLLSYIEYAFFPAFPEHQSFLRVVRTSHEDIARAEVLATLSSEHRNMIVPPTFRRLVMNVTVAVIASLVLAFSHAVSAPDAQSDARRKEVENTYRKEVIPFLKTYCVDCHGDKKRKGGLDFTKMFKRPEAGELRRQWQNALVHVREHDMPPKDAAKQPTELERRTFMDWIGRIKFLSPEDPGPYVIRRLTKAEYGNTLKDLFGVDPSVVAELPDDVAGPGYLNTLSPLQTEQYLAIANTVLDRVLGPPEGPPTDRQQKLFGKLPDGGDARDAARKVARIPWPAAPIAGPRKRRKSRRC